MAQTGKQTPLGVNVTGSFLENKGLRINTVAESYMGVSHTNEKYQFGSIVNDTCLYWLTYSIFDGYNKGPIDSNTLLAATYNKLISISGSGKSNALGNSKPPTYEIIDPRTIPLTTKGMTQLWRGVATTGYAVPNPTDPSYREKSTNTYRGQSATWIPYMYDVDLVQPNHSITMWGFIRCFALQAWNEFNWNGEPMNNDGPVEYKEFLSSFLEINNYIEYQNTGINTLKNSQTFQKGTYSNMNDLTTAGVTDVSLATQEFGQDCIALGKAIDLSKIDKFGLPSVLLQTLKNNNAITQSLSLALISAGLSISDIEEISSEFLSNPTKVQEQKIYGAFLIIKGIDLKDILIPLNCKTQGLTSLADLLNVKKLFPNSYQSLTVPLYNATPVPTNSKTYYPLFDKTGINSRLTTPSVVQQVGSIVPVSEPLVSSAPNVMINEQVVKKAVNTDRSIIDIRNRNISDLDNLS